ncbi:trophoblast glycoprotein-like [Mercenaria mercenaria]|uniref:trophoblast glycoprotein-like n=1 Tax=Mercenaria mercenaria TaxID=6596 RepID=UPI00234E4808|nr:trophoblast glycoprotein-like [Mercenaria mercenaria]
MADREYYNRMISFLFVLVSLVLCLGQDLEEKCAKDLEGCYCTDRYIDCSGAEFTDIRDIYPYITNQTYRIHITGGRICSIPDNVFEISGVSGPLNNVVYLNLSGNNIETVGRASFQQLPNLQVLDLSYSDILVNLCDPQNDFSTSLAPLRNIEELYLSHVFSKEVSGSCDPGNVFPQTRMSNLKKLDMSSNNFNLIGTKMDHFLCDTISIQTLNLSRNDFGRFPVSQCMTNVEVLDVSSNLISVLSPEEMDVVESLVNLKALYLGGNPFQCDCFLDNAFHWLNVTTVPLDFDKIVCGGETDITQIIGKPIKSLNYTDICEGPEIIVCGFWPSGRKIYLSKTTFIAGLSGGVVLIIFVITVVVVLCRRRRQRRRQHHSMANSQIVPAVAKTTAYSRMV